MLQWFFIETLLSTRSHTLSRGPNDLKEGHYYVRQGGGEVMK